MMRKCPKCGFVQPEDQFCANCGIDMEAFVPPPQPISKKIFNSMYFYVALLAIGCIGLYSFIQWKQDSDMRDRAQLFDEGDSTVVQKRLRQYERRKRESRKTRQEPLKQQAMRAATPPPEETESEENYAPPAQQKVPSIKISYYELPIAALEQILEAGNTISSFGEYNAGLLPNIQEKISAYAKMTGSRSLGTADSFNVSNNTSKVIQRGQQISEQNIGLTIQIITASIVDQGLPINIEILRELRDYQGESYEIIDQTFSEEFLVPLKSGIFVAGTLPHRGPQNDEENELFASDILRVYGSENFRQGAHEFVIFIVPDF